MSSGKRGIVVPVRQPIGRWARESRAGLVGLAVLIGAGAGLGAVVFRWLITSFTHLFSGHQDYSAAGRVAHPWFPELGPWFLLLAPVVAGLVYGPLVHRFAPEARGHGVPEVMYAVAERGGRIPVQVSVVKALASALTIGSGGSVGREGPIVQIGSALGSALGRTARLPESRLRVLVACGAAGGIAATFVVLGLVVGACGVLFTRALYWIEDLCDRLWRGPEWLRPAVGGVFLGGLLLVLPQMYGVGYPVLQNAVEGRYVLGFLLVLLLGKIVATSLTIGIGGSGGVFAPSLFIGAMAGTAFGIGVHAWLPSMTASPGVYGLIGMGAAFAGAARAPITAVIVLFELTGQYTVILPMLTAIVIATAVSRALSRDTIYTLKLRRRGIDLDKHPSARRMEGTKVSAVTEPLPEPLREDLPLELAAHALALSGHGILPVVDEDGRYQGCATARAVAEAVAEDHEGRVGDLAELPPLVTSDSTLADALDALAQAPGTGLPVLTGADELTGWITHQSVLTALEPAATGR